MANVIFNNYTPPSPPPGVFDIAVGVFFDGTKNNMNNTNARRSNSQSYKRHGGDTEDNNSYNNDWSNVAKLWDNYDKKNSIYIEGIGTEDDKADDLNGYAFGSKETGITSKVRIGCEKIAEKVKALKNANPTGKLQTVSLDAFGFSRGAAAARHFVYEASKTSKSEKFGLLGSELRKQGVETDDLVIKVRFLGIFDTVSSFSENVWTTDPNFSNDIEELHLNDIGKAKKIVHFIAENEHRINFDLTDVVAYDKVKRKRVHMGTEKTFPGVHSDIGGGYENGVEKKDEIINGSESVQKTRKEQLVSEGWFTDEQLIIHEYRRKLSSNRYVKKTYSYIPLHFMGEYGVDSDLPFTLKKMTNMSYSISNDSLLVRVKDRLRSYVMNDGKPYSFRWYHEIHKQYKGSKIPEQRHALYQKELDEQKDLRKLRNGYLHWSADYDWVGMDPREDGVRVIH